MMDDLPLDEIYDHDTEEKERSDWEIEALERKEQVENERDEIIERHVDVAAKMIKEEMMRVRLMHESLKKIHEILELPKR